MGVQGWDQGRQGCVIPACYEAILVLRSAPLPSIRRRGRHRHGHSGRIVGCIVGVGPRGLAADPDAGGGRLHNREGGIRPTPFLVSFFIFIQFST